MPYLACQWKLWRPGLWVLIHIDELFFASSMTEVMKGASCAPSGRCTFGESTRGVAGQCPACPGLFSRRPSGGPRRRGTMPTQDSGPGLPPGEWLCRPSGGPRRRWRLKAEPCARTPFVACLGGSCGRLKGGREVARGKPGNAWRRPGSTPQNAQRPEGAQETRVQPLNPSAALGLAGLSCPIPSGCLPSSTLHVLASTQAKRAATKSECAPRDGGGPFSLVPCTRRVYWYGFETLGLLTAMRCLA